jgi:hypothetical protein
VTPSSKILFTTPAQDRFFLVPAERTLPEGDLRLTSLDGEDRRVDPDAAAPYEVSGSEAEAHVRTQAQRALDDVAETVARALGMAGRRPPDLQALAERLGVRGGDRKATEAAIRGLAEDMQVVTAAVASGDPAALEAARARLQARGIDVGDALGAVRRLDAQQAGKAAASTLRALADALEGPGEQPLGRRIDELIERLDREVGPFVGRDPERARRKRQEGYERDARSAIAQSLRDAGIEPLNER